MSHETTLVFDLDDTISFTTNRDWENATPNQPLIQKINSLYDKGWTIHIVTARGQLSCDGDVAKADSTYRAIIEAWLTKNQVKYHSLSFQKKLAAYYVDDKAMRPDEFVKDFSVADLSGGMSGAKVVFDRFSGTIMKTDKNTRSVVEWYKAAKEYGYHVPEIKSVIGDTIKMEYINRDTDELNLSSAVILAASFRKNPPIYMSRTDQELMRKIEAYGIRCVYRLGADYNEALGVDVPSLAKRISSTLSTSIGYETFSHGDYSLGNLMFKGGELYMIDPISESQLVSHWILDVAKLGASILTQCDEAKYVYFRDNIVANLGYTPLQDKKKFDTLVMSQMLRMIPYATGVRLERILGRTKFVL